MPWRRDLRLKPAKAPIKQDEYPVEEEGYEELPGLIQNQNHVDELGYDMEEGAEGGSLFQHSAPL